MDVLCLWKAHYFIYPLKKRTLSSVNYCRLPRRAFKTQIIHLYSVNPLYKSWVICKGDNKRLVIPTGSKSHVPGIFS